MLMNPQSLFFLLFISFSSLVKMNSSFQVLQQQLDSAVDLEMGLREELTKYREENEDLKFQVM